MVLNMYSPPSYLFRIYNPDHTKDPKEFGFKTINQKRLLGSVKEDLKSRHLSEYLRNSDTLRKETIFISMTNLWWYILAECYRRGERDQKANVAMIDVSKLGGKYRDVQHECAFARIAGEYVMEHSIPPEATVHTFKGEDILQLSILGHTSYKTMGEVCLSAKKKNSVRGSLRTGTVFEDLWDQVKGDEDSIKAGNLARLVIDVFVNQIEPMVTLKNSGMLGKVKQTFRIPQWFEYYNEGLKDLFDDYFEDDISRVLTREGREVYSDQEEFEAVDGN